MQMVRVAGRKEEWKFVLPWNFSRSPQPPRFERLIFYIRCLRLPGLQLAGTTTGEVDTGSVLMQPTGTNIAK